MNLNHLAYFRVLGNTEHYTKAATELNITQPSLSHAIRALEEDLGTALFEKQGRNVKLTKYGKFFHGVVEKALNDLEVGERQLRNSTSESGGQVDLAFIYTLGSYFIPGVIKDFKSMEEHDNIKFTFFQSSTRDIIQGIKEERFDIGLCSYKKDEPDITFTKLYEEKLVVIVPLDHPLACRDSIHLEELQDESIVYYKKGCTLRSTIDELFEERNVTPNVICEVLEDGAIAGLVSVGYGVSIVPDIPILDGFPVKKLAISSPHNSRSIYLATLNNHFLTPSVYKFYQYLIDNPHR